MTIVADGVATQVPGAIAELPSPAGTPAGLGVTENDAGSTTGIRNALGNFHSTPLQQDVLDSIDSNRDPRELG